VLTISPALTHTRIDSVTHTRIDSQLAGPCARLALLPSTAEAATAALLAKALLGMDWVWCFMLGYVMAAISPAVVVPSILHLHDQGACRSVEGEGERERERESESVELHG
jgi:hypothetical protein